MAYSPDDRTLAVTTDGGAGIQLWDLATRRLELGLRRPRNYAFNSASYGRGGQLLAASDDHGIGTYVWDVATRRPLRTAATLRSPDGTEVASFADSPDGRSLAVGDYQGHIYLWSVSRLP